MVGKLIIFLISFTNPEIWGFQLFLIQWFVTAMRDSYYVPVESRDNKNKA